MGCNKCVIGPVQDPRLNLSDQLKEHLVLEVRGHVLGFILADYSDSYGFLVNNCTYNLRFSSFVKSPVLTGRDNANALVFPP